MNRCHACAVAGLAACAHLAVLGVTDAAHPRERETRPTVAASALPPEPPHTHQDYDRYIRFRATGMVASGTATSEALPPGRGFISGPQYRARSHYPSWSAKGERLRSWRASSSRPPRRSGTG